MGRAVGIHLVDITEKRFRANERYEPVLFDRLPPDLREMLADLRKDPELFGILRPRSSSSDLGVKSICRATALLHFVLREPGHLPEYVRRTLGEECNAAVTQLVLDGVIEVEDGERGFVSGASAHHLLRRPAESISARSRVAQLSVEALKYAQRLQVDDAATLSARLYFFHRDPVSPEWLRRLPDSNAVAEYLDLRSGELAKKARRAWDAVTLPPNQDRWFMFRRAGGSDHDPDRPTYKLYVSPRAAQTRSAFRATLDLLFDLDVRLFKVANDVHGLHRPDKIVVYFDALDDVRHAASLLLPRLSGIEPQGVPFTTELAGDGLLSWGLDPPRKQQLLGWQERESWRLWVTNRLAVALLVARATESTGSEPWRYALDRLRLDGIDTETWSPVDAPWSASGD
jgi:hypothetical protein